MIYVGSKRNIAKEILPIILQNRKQNQWYVEPFCGGLNIFDKVYGNRIASDNNKYLIAMWNGLQNGRNDKPMHISKELYHKAKIEYDNGTNIEYDDFLIGWIGYMASFRGKFYAGYSGGYNKRNYIDENIRNISKQIDSLNGAKIVCSSYQELIIPNNSIIYCDIPYKNTTGYSFSEEFNHEDFWQWCRKMAKQNHEIFVSEYSAPDDFTCVWQKYIKNTLGTNSSYETIQKLWKINKE